VYRNAGKSGKWQTSLFYEYLGVIKAWGRLPSQFGICAPEEDLQYMLARERMESKINEWQRGE
jgi:hypothetical protein